MRLTWLQSLELVFNNDSARGIEWGANSNVKTLDAIQRALEESGIQFIGSPEDGPGVRLFPKE